MDLSEKIIRFITMRNCKDLEDDNLFYFETMFNRRETEEEREVNVKSTMVR